MTDTAFQKKLQALAKQTPTVGNIYSPEYKERIWTILIACGGATQRQTEVDENEDWRTRNNPWGSYYGSNIDMDVNLTERVVEEIIDHGINWNACSDPAEHKESRFNGTFTDTQLNVTFFIGTLVTNAGNSYYWGSMVPEEMNFGFLIGLITKLDLTLDEAIEQLILRIGKSKEYGNDNSYFSYFCNIPEVYVGKYYG